MAWYKESASVAGNDLKLDGITAGFASRQTKAQKPDSSRELDSPWFQMPPNPVSHPYTQFLQGGNLGTAEMEGAGKAVVTAAGGTEMMAAANSCSLSNDNSARDVRSIVDSNSASSGVAWAAAWHLAAPALVK
jgi:hypothetical protein